MGRFELAFGGDEFNFSRFSLEKKSSNVVYVGDRKISSGRFVYSFYEFKTDDAPFLYVDGSAMGSSIFLALREPPGDAEIEGQAAKVFVLDRDGVVVPVGRAVLWKKPPAETSAPF